ncbi:MAG: hypothetical protein H0X40_10985 [Chthoniobacterales bacterium]|nr:hypothetical protein [Chthoniobacterales bacterium]
MDEELHEDWLDARLREEAAYIDDAGFTAQLMQKVPARRTTRTSLRGAVLLGITMLACVITYLASDGGHFLVSAVQTLAAMPLWILFVVATFCAVVVTVGAASAAYLQVRDRS